MSVEGSRAFRRKQEALTEPGRPGDGVRPERGVSDTFSGPLQRLRATEMEITENAHSYFSKSFGWTNRL